MSDSKVNANYFLFQPLTIQSNNVSILKCFEFNANCFIFHCLVTVLNDVNI